MRSSMQKAVLFLSILTFLTFKSMSVVSAYYTNMSADLVLGQTDFVSSSNTPVSASSLGSPWDMIICQGKFILGDFGNHRVLIWNNIPTTNGKPADVVIGQPTFSTNTLNYGGASAASLNNPAAVVCINDRLVVADKFNHRILIFNSIPTSNGASADVVIGQTNFSNITANGGGSIGANTLNSPGGLATDGRRLFVVDDSNSRVLIYNSLPTSNNASADLVVGAPDFVTDSPVCTATGLGLEPLGIATDGKRLIVADAFGGNNRVLIWNNIPTTNGTSADIVLGQVDFTTCGLTQTGAYRIIQPFDVEIDRQGRLLVADRGDNRVLIYNTLPTTNNTAADLVIGQSNFSGSTANQGTSVAANTLSAARKIFTYQDKLYVADTNNNRVLIYNNVISTPQIGISKIEDLSDGRKTISGTVNLGQRGVYSLANIKASVNSEGYGDVTMRDNGRDNGVNQTLYEYSHTFSPWQNNGTKETWVDRGYVVRLKALTNNGDDSTIVYFKPFELTSVSSDTSYPLFTFKVNKYQWNNLVDSLDSYEIETKRSNESVFTTFIDKIPVSTSSNPSLSTTHDSSTGIITVKANKKYLKPGSYQIRVVAKDKWGYRQESNSVSYNLSLEKNVKSEFIPSNSAFHLSVTNITGIGDPYLSSYLSPVRTNFLASADKISISGIAYSNSKITLTLIQHNCKKDSSCTKTYTTNTLPTSKYNLSIPKNDLLSNTSYTAFLSATQNNLYAEVPAFVIRK